MTEELHTVCPFCGHHHDRISAVRSDVDFPNDGAVSICFRCGRACIFDDGELRKPTKKEQRELARDDDLNKILIAWRLTRQ